MNGPPNETHSCVQCMIGAIVVLLLLLYLPALLAPGGLLLFTGLEIS